MKNDKWKMENFDVRICHLRFVIFHLPFPNLQFLVRP